MSSFANQHITQLISKSTRHFQNFRSYHTLPFINASRINYNLYHRSHRRFASKPNEPSSSPLPHHYTTLYIDENAPIDDVKKSYNNLIKQWHPDLYVSKPLTQQQEAQTKFLLIREAYETIITHKEYLLNPTISAAQKQPSKSKPYKRTAANTRYSYYSWGPKIHGTQTNDESNENSDENEEAETETEEIRYSESYKQNQTWIGKTMEELYDWMVFLYQRNPSWLQFFMVATACAGVAQGIWHFVNPHINDSDPDRLWNVFKFNKKHQGSGFQPSSTAAMETTPSLVALQPHFKGHTLYVKEEMDNDNKYKGNIEEDFSDVEKDSALKMFLNLNSNSTVNRDLFDKKQKRYDIDFKTVDTVENDEKKSEAIVTEIEKKVVDQMDIKDIKKSKGIKLLEYDDIPLELRTSPTGVLLASYAVKSGELPKLEENGQYDWSAVIEKYKKLNEQNDNEQLQAQAS